ncbi:MAG: ABC transporter permease [Pontiellaceae bacterium]|nr:ABC transporter permease [Pontiellaceae bacterium]MBN2785345.1 ABC transporter permease [Pontiellaceae bacterium]
MPGQRMKGWMISLPSMAWLTVFFLLPTLMIFIIAFKPANPLGGLGEGWTLRTWLELGNPNYPSIIWRTLRLSFYCTAACILLGIPFSYYIARAPERRQRALLLLVIIPFWTNFLIRVFAWKAVLHPEGALKHMLVAVGIASPDTMLLYNEWAVLLVMVYTYLPFAIMPLYAAIEKFDFALLDAALDLGAGRATAMRRVFLPGIRRGIQTAVLMVLIPALGSYVIPDILGGPSSEMLGNKIAQRAFADRNLPHSAALSALLCLCVMLPMLMGTLLRRKRTGGAA